MTLEKYKIVVLDNDLEYVVSEMINFNNIDYYLLSEIDFDENLTGEHLFLKEVNGKLENIIDKSELLDIINEFEKK